MARYRMAEESESAVSIELSEVAGKQDLLLAAFESCQAGRCSCPTREYEKLDSIKIETGPDRVRLRLEPKKGERFDLPEIAACLDYTTSKAAGTEA